MALTLRDFLKYLCGDSSPRRGVSRDPGVNAAWIPANTTPE